MNPERARLQHITLKKEWKEWGPYLSERQWGTVREDYSEFGTAWDFFPFNHSNARAYRWGEDGIAGISDAHQRICFAVSLWNGKDAFTKERLFGLDGNSGVHGEDVKELYYYLDSTPTHSYMKYLYKYPQAAFPYDQLCHENDSRENDHTEFELIDTGIFNDNRYFDVVIEYAKAEYDDIVIRITATNRGHETADLHILPTLWFRNNWSWDEKRRKPLLSLTEKNEITLIEEKMGNHYFYMDAQVPLLFCENETNFAKIFNAPNNGKFFKDGINECVAGGNTQAVNKENKGTKFAPHYLFSIEGQQSETIRLRLSKTRQTVPFNEFDKIFEVRKLEADIFYAELQENVQTEELKNIQRQAYAGLLWGKQYYGFNVSNWFKGDPTQPAPHPRRPKGRNSHWTHFEAHDIISMPDKWEYPWFAAWDLAFHCIPLCRVDPDFAKQQLELLLSENYMHPNGQLPAYEWAFDDVNPPVHAWAALRVYSIDAQVNGAHDIDFLERVFQKLLFYFTWWVNRKDRQGKNIFEGGFLGLDNVGAFDRGAPIPQGGNIEQADGTSWMAMFSLNMLRMAGILAVRKSKSYEDLCTKFFEHFLYIASAINNMGTDKNGLWDDDDKFYYDLVHFPDNRRYRVKVRSIVGLIPLFAVETISEEDLANVPNFKEKIDKFLLRHPELSENTSRWHETGNNNNRLLALLRGYRMGKVLEKMLDETEFLSDFGVRSLSKHYDKEPYYFELDSVSHQIKYAPGESRTIGFGSNSNWRGPIWFPLNYMIIWSLVKFYNYYGDDFKIEYPTGSGTKLNLKEISLKISERLIKLFKTEENHIAALGPNQKFQQDPNFNQHILFYEYFNGDTGEGLGASHQTGWTALVAELIHEMQPSK